MKLSMEICHSIADPGMRFKYGQGNDAFKLAVPAGRLMAIIPQKVSGHTKLAEIDVSTMTLEKVQEQLKLHTAPLPAPAPAASSPSWENGFNIFGGSPSKRPSKRPALMLRFEIMTCGSCNCYAGFDCDTGKPQPEHIDY